ncbi:MAG: nicotinate-nucleotide adenylyltransferase [Proteobacteria bacterium]|nr:nicotinate-nucleotide adenylyltransferase [Pseudomonadota bacterium]
MFRAFGRAGGERRTPRIGLLGGSFNPAHEGHLHISRLALGDLDLDRVWWLVSPQNPLKPVAGMAAYGERLRDARRMARDRRIHVSGIERRLGCRYTAETLRRLGRLYPRVRFVWLMGADNLVQIAQWRDWTAIFEAVPVAIFDRPSYSKRALESEAAKRFQKFRLASCRARSLANRRPPAWVFFPGRLSGVSAAGIREGRAGSAPVQG